MTDLLGLAAIVPASAGACCTVGARRPGRGVDVVAAVAMVAAMADGSFGLQLLPGFAWFAVLALLAVIVAAAHRFERDRHPVRAADGRRGSTTAGRPAPAHGRSGRPHAALGLLVMGAMGVGAAHGPGTVGMAAMSTVYHAGTVGVTWTVVLGGLTAGYLVLTAVMVHGGVRRRSAALPLVETTTMGIAVAVMAVAMASA